MGGTSGGRVEVRAIAAALALCGAFWCASCAEAETPVDETPSSVALTRFLQAKNVRLSEAQQQAFVALCQLRPLNAPGPPATRLPATVNGKPIPAVVRAGMARRSQAEVDWIVRFTERLSSDLRRVADAKLSFQDLHMLYVEFAVTCERQRLL